MKIYTCPMHEEIKSKKPGKCPICHMDLVEKDTKNSGKESSQSENSYRPLIVVVSLIFLTALSISLKGFLGSGFDIFNFIENIMIGFFIVFAGFKLVDLRGFADGYATYDLLAKRWYGYGYVYPFIELFFGFSMILSFQMDLVLWLEIFIMSFSGLGVVLKLMRNEKFQCACLGTFLKVPLTKVTLIEDFGMAALAAILLFLS